MRIVSWGIMIAVIYILFMEKDIPDMKIPENLVKEYVAAGNTYQIPWMYLAAIDEVEHKYQKSSRIHIEKKAKQMADQLKATDDLDKVVHHLYPDEKAERIISTARAYEWGAPMLGEDYQFPFRLKDRAKLSYQDTWGASRTYGGKRKHEGTDVMTRKGVPLLAVTDGLIIRKGWNQLGGWRISLLDIHHPQIVYYYAHLKEFSPDLQVGSYVRKGDIIGYVGDSGYGREGTTGKFPPHLHFGIYVREGWFKTTSKAINSYPFLKAWDPLNK